MDTDDPLLDARAVAHRLGRSREAVETALRRARRHREAGTPEPGDMPEPDVIIGGRPAWLTSTIEAWIPRRPSSSWKRKENR